MWFPLSGWIALKSLSLYLVLRENAMDGGDNISSLPAGILSTFHGSFTVRRLTTDLSRCRIEAGIPQFRNF
jgi:hypothetical protein